MKLVKISVFVDVEDSITPERVLKWVDDALFAEPYPEGFDTFQTGIGQVRNQPDARYRATD